MPALQRSAEGRALGLLGGTVAELSDHFGVGANDASFIQPGNGRPVFAQQLIKLVFAKIIVGKLQQRLAHG